ncbi:hypothetical protein AB5N19_12389 [Seiridium cardinale]
MAVKSRPYCAYLPENTITNALSAGTLKTLITTTQGIQFVVLSIGGALQMTTFNHYSALDSMFSPLAAFGLLRLFAATWLSEDFAFSAHATGQPTSNAMSRRYSMDSLLECSALEPSSGFAYHQPSYLPSRIVRGTFVT